MKMKCLYVAVAAAVLSLAACRSSKDAVSVNDLDGEWNVVEIQGQAVQAESQPFIGFDTKEGRVYGNSGCNQMMGAFTFSAPNHLELGDMASTMRACPDMDTERQVLEALASVRSLEVSGKELLLYSGGKKPVMRLQKRFEVVPLSSLNGEWKVVAVNGTALPAMENIPAFSLDMTTHRIGGNSGCNRLSGEIRHDAAVENSISFANVASTRMACPDLKREQAFIEALESATHYDMDGPMLLILSDGELRAVFQAKP